MHQRFVRAGLAGLAFCLATAAAAGERATPREAKALFDQAVKYLEANGPDKAWPAFNDRKGPFVRKDLYVYAIDRQGTYVANGAAPDALVGLKVIDSVDAAGNPIFRQMIALTEKQADGRIRYVWLNRKTNDVEPKMAWLHRQGDYILGVGYYAPRSSAEDAQKLLKEAADLAARQGMDKAAAAFNEGNGRFVRDDLYVFAVNMQDGRFEAHGGNPKLTGTDASALHDVEGNPLVRKMLEQARAKGEGVVDYVWRNPVTNAVERKRTFVRRVNDSMVAVGYYLE